MISGNKFIEYLSDVNVTFFAGVPDSLLSGFCASLSENVDDRHHVIAANEGNAVALATGYHIATGEVPCVYLQNSGLGNMVNPLISLVDPSVCSIPILLLIGWRGEPGVTDEPQHIRQGELTIPLLETLGIPHFILPREETGLRYTIEDATKIAKSKNRPVAILVKKETFCQSSHLRTTSIGAQRTRNKEQITPDNEQRTKDEGRRTKDAEPTPSLLSREQAIELIIESISSDDMIVSTTGKASRELYEIRKNRGEPHDSDFLVVGSMGHASQIAAGVALAKPKKRVICLDGDGALLMHMGGIAINASLDIPNFRHIVLNNGAHDSVGGMPTVGLEISVEKIADACGYTNVISVSNEKDLRSALPLFMLTPGPSLMNIIVKIGSRRDLGRPKITPIICKERFMKQL